MFVRIVGAEVPLSDFCELIRRLHEDGARQLAVRLGRLLDAGTYEITVARRDEGELLLATQRHRLEGLEDLRLQLLKRAHLRATV